MAVTGSRTPGLLAGKTVLVTRPAEQAGGIQASLEHHRATVIRFPSLIIRAPEDPDPATRLLRNLNDYDTVIFSSANAVRHAAQLLQTLGRSFSTQCIAAIGPATRDALENLGMQADVVPEAGFSSEDLLAHEGLRGQDILIIRGVGGRGHLARELRARGSRVDIAEVYQRLCPATRPAHSLCIHPENDSAVLAYSGESMRNLWTLCTKEEHAWLAKAALIAGSPRIARTATAIGFSKTPIIAANASDAAMLDALLTWTRET